MITIALTIFNRYKWIIFTAILGFVCWLLIGKINDLIRENDRISRNHIAAMTNFDHKFKEVTLNNGKIIQSVTAMSVKVQELKNIDSELNKRIKDLNINVKNLQAITDIGFNYNVNIDSLRSIFSEIVINDSIPGNTYKRYKFSKVDEYINLTSDLITFQDETIAPQLTNFNIKLTDSLLILPEVKYKRVWLFWKRPTGVDLKINSSSPYYKVDYIKHYEFIKK